MPAANYNFTIEQGCLHISFQYLDNEQLLTSPTGVQGYAGKKMYPSELEPVEHWHQRSVLSILLHYSKRR